MVREESHRCVGECGDMCVACVARLPDLSVATSTGNCEDPREDGMEDSLVGGV